MHLAVTHKSHRSTQRDFLQKLSKVSEIWVWLWNEARFRPRQLMEA